MMMTARRVVGRAAAAVAMMLLAGGLIGAPARSAEAPPAETPRCPRCDAAVEANAKVVVTDFAAKRDLSYCSLLCALREMGEKYPTSRAVARDPFARKEVRIIRTGARWTAWPTTAVFLYLPAAKDLSVGQRCSAFARQDEYIRYLATHPEVSAHKPRPRRLNEVLAALKAPAK